MVRGTPLVAAFGGRGRSRAVVLQVKADRPLPHNTTQYHTIPQTRFASVRLCSRAVADSRGQSRSVPRAESLPGARGGVDMGVGNYGPNEHKGGVRG